MSCSVRPCALEFTIEELKRVSYLFILVGKRRRRRKKKSLYSFLKSCSMMLCTNCASPAYCKIIACFHTPLIKRKKKKTKKNVFCESFIKLGPHRRSCTKRCRITASCCWGGHLQLGWQMKIPLGHRTPLQCLQHLLSPSCTPQGKNSCLVR